MTSLSTKGIKNRVKDAGPYLINEKWIGVASERTVGVIIDNIDRPNSKKQVKIMRTENVNLLAGLDTVAVFNIKRHVTGSNGEECVAEL